MTTAQWIALAACVAVPGSLVVLAAVIRGYNVLIWRHPPHDCDTPGMRDTPEN